jgi:hypothetical protein
MKNGNPVKTYLVIETNKPGCLAAVYARFHDQGRMLPPGLFYLNSWLEKDGPRCFQLMETEDPRLFAGWIKRWEDLVDFEVVEIGEKPRS